MLANIGLPELVLILLLVVVLFGPGKLPDVGKALGEAMRGFKKAINEPDEKSPIRSDKKRSI